MPEQEQQLFTLDEAAVELRKRQCREFGHGWNVECVGEVPVAVHCDSCGARYRVEPLEGVEA